MPLFGAKVCIQIILHPLGILPLHLQITAESDISSAVDAIFSVIASNLGSTLQLLVHHLLTLATHYPIPAMLAFGDKFLLDRTYMCYSISTYLLPAMSGPLSTQIHILAPVKLTSKLNVHMTVQS